MGKCFNIAGDKEMTFIYEFKQSGYTDLEKALGKEWNMLLQEMIVNDD